MKRSRLGLLPLFISVLFLGSVVYGLSQRQALYDWLRLRDYEPPAQIAALATETTMNDSARRLFYVYHPELNDRREFNQNCTNNGEETIVLGCYVVAAGVTGIYLFDVDDPRLEGVEQVTAAHELLHAAYDRLSDKERSRIDGLTQDVLQNLADERIRTTVENYRKRDPSVVPNELHSILATEVRDLPQELEDHYRKYFNDRKQIVAFSEKYETILSQRKERAAQLEVELNGLKHEIEQLEKTLADLRDGLHKDRPSVDTQEEVVAYNARVNSYNAEIRELNNLINRYNLLVQEYKSNAVEQQELFKALDSRPAF